MVGLDVTHRVVTPLHLFQRIAAHQRHRATDTLLHAVAFYATFYSARHPHIAPTPSCFAHDVLAFVYLVQPGLFNTAAGSVRVVTEGPEQGQTVFEPHPANALRSPTQVCLAVDAPACLALLEDTLAGDWLLYSQRE